RGGGRRPPASRAPPFLARSVATCTCLTSANMSGASRVLSSTDGSIFLAAANASALSRIADSALRPISSAGGDAFDIENDMGLTPLLSTTVGWAKMRLKGSALVTCTMQHRAHRLDIRAIQWWARCCFFSRGETVHACPHLCPPYTRLRGDEREDPSIRSHAS